jgi:hypothetical protein
MNTSQTEQILISLGFTFSKTHDKVSEKNMWLCLDEDGIPIASSHYRGELIKSVSTKLGGI